MYSQKVKNALQTADTLEKVVAIEERIKTTSQVNRRTKAGRELTKELLATTQAKAMELINKGDQAF